MRFADLFAIDCNCDGARDEDTPRLPDRPLAVGIFTTPQSLLVFPLSTSIVATVARASRTIFRTEFDSIVVPLTTSIVIGVALFLVTALEERSRPKTWSGWLTMAATTAVNSLLLFVAALGIEKF